MLAIQNSVGFSFGTILHGHADGPLGISALPLITAMLVFWMAAIHLGKW
jgi:hypothetical protein